LQPITWYQRYLEIYVWVVEVKHSQVEKKENKLCCQTIWSNSNLSRFLGYNCSIHQSYILQPKFDQNNCHYRFIFYSLTSPEEEKRGN